MSQCSDKYERKPSPFIFWEERKKTVDKKTCSKSSDSISLTETSQMSKNFVYGPVIKTNPTNQISHRHGILRPCTPELENAQKLVKLWIFLW